MNALVVKSGHASAKVASAFIENHSVHQKMVKCRGGGAAPFLISSFRLENAPFKVRRGKDNIHLATVGRRRKMSVVGGHRRGGREA